MGIAVGARADFVTLNPMPDLAGREGDYALDSYIFAGGHALIDRVYAAGKLSWTRAGITGMRQSLPPIGRSSPPRQHDLIRNRALDDTALRYLEIRRDIQNRIASGELRPGDAIPSEHELKELYGCSRMTVSKALSALTSEGLIQRRRRAGSQVAMPRNAQTVLKIHDLKAEIAASGRAYRCEILSREARARCSKPCASASRSRTSSRFSSCITLMPCLMRSRTG